MHSQLLPLPDVDAALEELKHSIEVLKLDGVVLLSNYDGYYLGDPRFDKLFSELNRLNAVVFIHPATPPGIEQSHLGFPEAMMDVCFDTTRTVFYLIINGVTKNYKCPVYLSPCWWYCSLYSRRLSILSSLFEGLGGIGSYVAEGANMISHLIP